MIIDTRRRRRKPKAGKNENWGCSSSGRANGFRKGTSFKSKAIDLNQGFKPPVTISYMPGFEPPS